MSALGRYGRVLWTVLGVTTASTLASGCASAYSVVRYDEHVEFDPGTWRVASTQFEASAGDFDSSAFDEGVLAGLEERAGGFQFTRDDEARYSVTLRVLRTERDMPRARAEVEVVLADASGREVGVLRMRPEVETHDAEADARELGAEVGRRTMHYIHNHEQHHY